MARILAVLLGVLLCTGCSKEHQSLLALLAPAPAPGVASLLVSTYPGSASVLIDGSALAEPTPVVIQARAGDHSIRCTFPGYADTTLHVHLDAAQDSLRDSLVIVLRPLEGTPRAFSTWPFLGRPLSFDVGVNGNLFIAMASDRYAHLEVFNSTGSQLSSWTHSSSLIPTRVRTDSANNIYFGTLKFSTPDAYLYRLEPANINVYDLAVGPGDSVYTYCSPSGILVYGPSNGTAVRQLPLYAEVVVGLDGMLYSCGPRYVNGYPTTPSNRIFKYSANGDSVSSWSITARGAIDVGPDGNIYVMESPGTYSPAKTPGLIEKFSPDGVLLARWGVENPGVLPSVIDIAVGPNLDVYTIAKGGNRVLCWTN